MYDVDFSTGGKALSTFMAIFILVGTQISVMGIAVVLYRNRNNLQNEDFKDKYGTLTEGLNV